MAPLIIPSTVVIEEEGLPHYKLEHVYPVKIGDILQSRYKIIMKLGYGGNSTVWLARDLYRWRWQDNQYAYLKIGFNTYAGRIYAKHELRITRHIAAANPSHLGRQFVRTHVDSFNLRGPYGTHVCIVFNMMREPLWSLQRKHPDGKCNSKILKSTLWFLLSGLDYLHDECKVIHSDLKPGNIILPLENMTLLDDIAKCEAIYPSPRKLVGDREIYISPNRLGPFKDGKSPGPPKIMDFNCSVRGDGAKPLTHTIQAASFRAPEVILGMLWTYSADIWNLGLMIWYLVENKPLCSGVDPENGEHTSRVHLAELIALLGPPPKELMVRGANTSIYFNSRDKFKSKNLIPRGRTLSSSITKLRGEDKAGFLELVRKMIDWVPERRKTAKELLNDPWLRKSLPRP